VNQWRYEKVPLAETQTTLGKQEICSVQCGYLSHCQNSAKNSHKILLKIYIACTIHVPTVIDWLWIGCWVMAKNDFQYVSCPPYWILNILIFGHMTVIKFQICCCRPNLDDFSWTYDDLTIVKMVAVCHLEFSNFWLCGTWPLSPCCCT